MLEKFQIESLATIDGGRIKASFDAIVQQLIEDCHDRPDLKSARTLTLTVSVVPIADKGALDKVDVTFALKDGIPKRKSRSYNMDVVRGGIVFNELSPDEVRQRTLDMAPKPQQTEGSSRKEGLSHVV